jgi:hypothetical protein
MNILSMIAVLAAAHVEAVNSPAQARVTQVLDASSGEAAARAMHAAVQWFHTAVARPLLAARDVEELQARLPEVRDEAINARMAIASAMGTLLATAPLTPDAFQVDGRIVQQLRAASTPWADQVAALLDLAVMDLADFWAQTHGVNPPTNAHVRAAHERLTPLATEAEIWLLVAVFGVHARADEVVLTHIVETAHTHTLRYRSALHATLRSWDAAWEPTVDAPPWADHVVPIDLDEHGVTNAARLFQEPPPPTPALRRLLAQR